MKTKNKKIELIDSFIEDNCSICEEEECETTFVFNNGLKIHWFDCEPDDEIFKKLVDLGVFEE